MTTLDKSEKDPEMNLKEFTGMPVFMNKKQELKLAGLYPKYSDWKIKAIDLTKEYLKKEYLNHRLKNLPF
jgi:hypothetical protein